MRPNKPPAGQRGSNPAQTRITAPQHQEQMKMIAAFKTLSFRVVCYVAEPKQYTCAERMLHMVTSPPPGCPPRRPTTLLTCLCAREPASLLHIQVPFADVIPASFWKFPDTKILLLYTLLNAASVCFIGFPPPHPLFQVFLEAECWPPFS